jgi:hypothetical protein
MFKDIHTKRDYNQIVGKGKKQKEDIACNKKEIIHYIQAVLNKIIP